MDTKQGPPLAPPKEGDWVVLYEGGRGGEKGVFPSPFQGGGLDGSGAEEYFQI